MKRAPAELTGVQARLVEILTTQPHPLFALLDGARDPRIRDHVKSCGEPFCSLYDGDELADFAPHLVRLERSGLLALLAKEGWGQSWGIYLSSLSSLDELREHFRRFLVVDAEEGRKYYFRFYDPRVLRLFLPTCVGEETRQFFGPVNRFLLEAETPELLLQYSASENGSQAVRFSLLY